MFSNLLKSQNTLENTGPEANREKNDHEAKTYQFGSLLDAILASFWGTGEAFRDHFGRLGANFRQHKAILSHLGANLRPPEANLNPT